MSVELSGRERLLAAVEQRKIDRPPLFFRADPIRADSLCRQLGLASHADLPKHFGSDALHVEPVFRQDATRPGESEDIFYDIFGNRWRKITSGDSFTNKVEAPALAGAENESDLDRITWPNAEILDETACVERARQAAESGLAVYGGVWASIFTGSRYLLGEEDYLSALVANPSLISALVARLTDCYLGLNRAYFDLCAQHIDIFYFGSDFGIQGGLFISPAMFRTFYKPHLARLAAQAKSYGLKVMYHTCGAVSEIIEDLIDCGIDILDPVQVSAAGMAPEELGRRFKGRICFHGGISTQTLLPVATPEKVYAVTRATIEQLGPGGYIVAPDQDMIGDVPLENIEAMLRAVREFRMM
ncbi:MAG TPA: uroporphyrinogen decarboxylase family protein [Candidatus Glassbacteria bacterium]|nr:uroporphyrinogen decarboxylase family protein [Candidatus Glassbacteria bacterium]